MNPPGYTLLVLLLQWTLLLTFAWGVHVLWRRRDPRWRLMLWRGVLLGAVFLPILRMLPLPRISLAQPRITLLALGTDERTAPRHAVTADQSPPAAGALTAGSALEASATTGTEVHVLPPMRGDWKTLLLVGWMAGLGWELLRLLRLLRQLRVTISLAAPASPPVQTLAQRIQRELNIRRDVRVRVSDTISSPFLSGVLRPTILLPRALAEELSTAEIEALLSHELAHQCRHDLTWCLAWKLMRAVCWFHPLVWKVPEAHTLACEEEADRIAARRLNDREKYVQLLAQMTLRVMRVPPIETELVLNATSHIALRLLRLGRTHALAWGWKHSAVAGAVATGLLTLSAGWQFAQSPTGEPLRTPIETATVLVTVVDDAGTPVAGAAITPTGLRAGEERLRGASYGWVVDRHGPVRVAITDTKGEAQVAYPVAIVPAEKISTGFIGFTVDHADFAKVWANNHPVDGTGKPVQLQRGIPVRVAGFFGPNRERVSGLVPVALGERLPLRVDEWRRETDGSLSTRRISNGKYFLHVSGRSPSGEVVFSDSVVFYGEQRDAHEFVMDMKPGVQVQGRIDSAVARPVKNGWVQLSVHSDDANTRQQPPGILRSWGNTGFWWSYRPLSADGSFEFESVPEGELKVIAYGDGFVSVSGTEEERPRPPGVSGSSPPPRRRTRAVPQSFAAVRPTTRIEVATEATATLAVIATADGKPVTGAMVALSPNMIQMPAGSRLFGAASESSESGFRSLPPMPTPSYSKGTDTHGRVVLRNVPAFTDSLSVLDSRFEVPLRSFKDATIPERFRPPPNRYVDVELSPGQTTEIEIALQPKGREFIGGR